ncbi:isopenicillin N synthase family dioxygenase [Actinomadura sp. SCN-SB]|uniref:isopenicillin N synthase family dioxygenase n=1 Tax=Actinomadura sp. SCN-SB TaxID=3373092 RepID=UPI003750EED0
MNSEIPVFDLAEWRAADSGERRRMARSLDAGLKTMAVFQLRGHGVPSTLADELRAGGRSFFRLPVEEKNKYQVGRPYDNGWRGLGAHHATALEGAAGAPDLHEVFHIGPELKTGRQEFDALYYPANKWPPNLPEFKSAADRYIECMLALTRDLLTVLAQALGVADDFFVAQSQRATWTQNVQWYPSLRTVGKIEEGQLRVGPHSDFGTIAILDRQPGVGGLQVWHPTQGWLTPPYDPESLTIIIGDLMEVWTDGRWSALRHRVQAPSAQVPEEDLTSLIFFYETDPDTVVTPLPPPIGGGRSMEPIVAGESILKKVGITLGMEAPVK